MRPPIVMVEWTHKFYSDIKIFNFKRVVESFMREKAKHEFMPDGKITIDSEISFAVILSIFNLI